MARTDKPLKIYRARYGMSRLELADFLTDRLGRQITEGGIQRYENYDKLPKSWIEALGLEAEETGHSVGPQPGLSEDDFAPLGGEDPRPLGFDDPPMMPPGGRQAPGAFVEPPAMGGARDRIAKAYNAIGAGVSMVTHNQGYTKVTEAYSDDLAKAWIAAARENANVAKIVEFMESGGPVGELVVCHIVMLLGFVYVSGRGDALEGIYGDKFGRYHNAALREREQAESAAGQAEQYGPGANGAQGPLADASPVAA